MGQWDDDLTVDATWSNKGTASGGSDRSRVRGRQVAETPVISIESRHPQSIRQGEVAARRDIWHSMGIRSCGPTGGCWRIPHWSVRI